MLTQIFTSQAVHVPDEGSVAWEEPHEMKEHPDSWAVTLKVWLLGGGHYSITFFGTEQQVRSIAKAPAEAEAVDPAQLDALADEQPAPNPGRRLADMALGVATAINGAGVARW